MINRRFAVLAAFALAACAPGDGEDQVAMDSASIGAMPDTMAAMPAAAKDGQHEFLRQMSDHHEGLVAIGEAAMNKGSTSAVQMDAHMLHTKQAAERDTMVQMIQQHYQEQHQPKAMPKNVAQADTLSQKSGADYDREFYRIVIDHHREGIAMIDQHLTHLTDPKVRQMAEKMRADMEKEIQEFERKRGGA